MAPTRRSSGRELARSAVAWTAILLAGAGMGMPRLAAQSSGGPAITSVSIAREGELTIVTIEADGALPEPTVGELDAPPRFFMDFAGVNASTRGTDAQPGNVLRVRVALYTSAPRVTRVVIDLKEKKPIRTEAGEREAGRFKILVGPVAPPEPAPPPAASPPPAARKRPTPSEPPAVSIPPVPALPAPADPAPPPQSAPKAAPATTTTAPPVLAPPPGIYPSRPPEPAPPDRDLERYREQVSPALERLRKMRTLLVAIDNREARPPDNLPAAREELSSVLRALTSVRTPDSMKGTHDLLLRSASLALMAATLRADAGTRADPEMMKNAASAAAGALLLLDRVCTAIGTGCGAAPEVAERAVGSLTVEL